MRKQIVLSLRIVLPIVNLPAYPLTRSVFIRGESVIKFAMEEVKKLSQVRCMIPQTDDTS